MSSDDFVLSDRARTKALAELEKASAPAPPAKDKRKRLLQIINNTQEPYHTRTEARHILEIADRLGLAEFNFRVGEFFDYYTAPGLPASEGR